MEIAITRSMALSADSSLRAVGTTVFRPEGAACDGAGDTTIGAVSPTGLVAWHAAARKILALKKASHDVRRRRTLMRSTLVVAGLGRNVARPPVLRDPPYPMSLKQFVNVS